MPGQSPKRGAIPSPKSVIAAAARHAVVVGAPPRFISVPPQLSMWGNDVHGDCVTAEEAFAKATNNPEIFISDSEVIGWATRHNVLEGAVISQVLEWMEHDGFSQDSKNFNDGPHLTVDWTNPAVLRSAIATGPVKIGVAADQLDDVWNTNGGRTGWFGVGFHADNNEDHCVSLCGYGSIAWLAQQLGVAVPSRIDGTRDGYALFTWNSIGIVDEPSLLAITHEAWLRRPTTVVEARGFFPLPGGAVFDHEKQHVAAVARAPGNLDLFVIGFDNRVWTTAWVDGRGWLNDWFPLPGGAVFDRDRQQIAAVARAPGNLDLFVIGFDNRVWTTAWVDGRGWLNDWFPLPGGAVFDHQKQKIAAVSRASGNLDLFVIGFDNRVWTTFWNAEHGWNSDWFPLPGGAVFDRDRQQIAAVARAPGNLDLFVIGFDNRVWTTAWVAGRGWLNDWFPLPGGAVFDHEKQQVAAVSRAPGNLDLFVVGFDNRIWTTFWNEQHNWNNDWFPLPGGAVFDHEKQQVAAVARAPGNLDLFVIGFDNRIWTTAWVAGRGWLNDWFPLPGGAVFDRERQRVAAVSRAPGNLDVFVLGFDNRGWTEFWNEQVGWN